MSPPRRFSSPSPPARAARRDGTAGNPPSTATQRAYDSATGSGPTPADGTRGNPSGTATERAFDRAAGTNTSGAYPAQRDGTAANPPGTAAERAYDRATGSNTSGAYPGNPLKRPKRPQPGGGLTPPGCGPHPR